MRAARNVSPPRVRRYAKPSRSTRFDIAGQRNTLHWIDGFDSEDEAVALANDTNYGLSASIWSRDTDKTVRASPANRRRTYLDQRLHFDLMHRHRGDLTLINISSHWPPVVGSTADPACRVTTR